ncbi:hypothetical protein [Ralstonia pickettii]|uniref:hypothetical protein n=1 Tax=Ralstonia pickettii TaxID=329 RepID=UPI0015F9B0B4|nr:hypothetical protein [Ralstonia pickettii]MBB0023663.1 hypothetical protein [Ralstonia pickettii]MBB0096978.1 hypothetical protein [Ralstonia pickettii]MBB0107052.1 hypothetical protein [Ralstonia pickettii]MBB0127751.1 hypothetical protein [Ralstonia pickettii]MBB0160752.1 hypothetical protein [Ralstonia pickettii]
MRVSDTEAAQRVADNDNLVGELVEALDGCIEHMEHSTPQGRAAYENAKAVCAKAKGAQQ